MARPGAALHRQRIEAAERQRAADRLQRLAAFTEDDATTSQAVLRRIMLKGNDKDARLAAERVRDELGLTRQGQTSQHQHSLTVRLDKPWAAPNSVEQQGTRIITALPSSEPST